MDWIKRLVTKYREFISYVFWGLLTTVVSWGSYSLFVRLFREQIGEMKIFGINMPIVVFIANVLSWVCAFLFAFITNKLWVFNSKDWQLAVSLLEFGKFLSTRFATGILEIVGVPLITALGFTQTIAGIEGMAAKVLVSIIVAILNYVFSKLFVFKK